jgi:hypothetical protein
MYVQKSRQYEPECWDHRLGRDRGPSALCMTHLATSQPSLVGHRAIPPAYRSMSNRCSIHRAHHHAGSDTTTGKG